MLFLALGCCLAVLGVSVYLLQLAHAERSRANRVLEKSLERTAEVFARMQEQGFVERQDVFNRMMAMINKPWVVAPNVSDDDRVPHPFDGTPDNIVFDPETYLRPEDFELDRLLTADHLA